MDIALGILAATLCNVWTWSVFYLALALLVLSNNKSVVNAVIICVLGVVVSLDYYIALPEVSFAVFVMLLARSRRITIGLLLWLASIVWAHLYAGDITLSDLEMSAFLRVAVGLVVYVIYYFVSDKISPHGKYISTHYTRSGYAIADLDMCISIIALTYLYVMLRTVIMA